MLVLKSMRDSCSLDQAEQPLQILLNTVLAKPFSLDNGSRDLTDVLLEYIDELDRESDLLSAWQRLSYYEWLIPRLQEQESGLAETAKDLFVALFRSNKEVSHVAV